MNTKSYSNVWTIEKQIKYIERRLDKYAKFYWRGEDMWEKYHTFITNNGSALKFVNGPSFSNEYSSPQYDHAMGNLTGVKFSRMQVSFTICTYGVTAAQYRSLIAALGPYEIDYLAFDYDNKLCYLAKTTGMKEGQKTVIGVDNNNNDLYMVENNITFEVQGEQCALAQRQYVWTVPDSTIPYTTIDGSTVNQVKTNVITDNYMLLASEKPFGVVGEIRVTPISSNFESQLDLYITNSNLPISQLTEENLALLCHITFNKITENWQNTQVDNNANQELHPQPHSFQDIDNSFSIKYDSASGLIFMQYGESDYKILDLLLTNTYGEYLVKNMSTTKMKIDKQEQVGNIHFIWKLTNFNFIRMGKLKIGNINQRSQSSYLKTLSIDGVTYTFGIDGNYTEIPGLVVHGTLTQDGLYTQFGYNSYIEFPISFNSVIKAVPYKGDNCWYQNYTDTNETIMSNSSTTDEEYSLSTKYEIVTPSTVQVYGRAKAILV